MSMKPRKEGVSVMSGVRVTSAAAAVVAAVLFLVTSSASVASSNKTGAAAPKPVSGGTLTLALNSGWDTLDPAQASFTFARQIMQFIFDPLIRLNPKTGAYEPDLATSWTFSNKNTTLTLQIRKGVHFQDHSLLTAQAVVYSLNRILNPALKSPWAAQLSQTV